MTTVAIIGSGPAGLLAAWGAWTAGANVFIFDAHPVYAPERIFSLQYLHHHCGLSLTIRSLHLEYKTMTILSREEARKAYNVKLGRSPYEENSTRFLWASPATVWSLKDAYKVLWSLFRLRIQEREVDWEMLTTALPSSYDLVVNTAPLNQLRGDLLWPVRTHLIAMDWTPIVVPDNTCIYNLDPEVPWYRTTNLDGGKATEFVSKIKDPEFANEWLAVARAEQWMPDLKPLRKVEPHSNSFGSLPRNLILTGRWGSWDPLKLTHHAYQDAKEAVRALQSV